MRGGLLLLPGQCPDRVAWCCRSGPFLSPEEPRHAQPPHTVWHPLFEVTLSLSPPENSDPLPFFTISKRKYGPSISLQYHVPARFSTA